MASSGADLRKIGVEGFALIDKFYGPQRRNGGFEEPAALNRKDGAAGIVLVNHTYTTSKAKFHQTRWGNRFFK